jgi:predicted permease
MGEELSHWRIYLIALGAAIAGTGLVVYGMGLAFREPRDFEINIGLALMAGGILAVVIGSIAYALRPEGEEEPVVPDEPPAPRY